MAIGVLQEVSAEDADFVTTGTTIAVTLTVTAGSVLHVYGTHDSAGTVGTIACSDTVNGSYGAAINDRNDATNGQRIAQFSKLNAASGSTTVTITLGTTHVAKGVWVVEINNARLTGALDGSNDVNQVAPGTGANAVTVSATNAVQPALVLAISQSYDGTPAPPAAGTGYTSTKTAFAWSGAAVTTRTEYKTVTNTGSQAATFTSSSGTATFTSMIAIYDDVSTSGPTINTHPAPQFAIAGQTATFTVSATATAGTLHYQWRKDGANVGTDSSSYTTPNTDTTYNGAQYDVVVTDDNGSTTSHTALLTVALVISLNWFSA